MIESQKIFSMIKSMTGYGKTVCELPTKRIIIEIKSLNSKQLDINLRLPTHYKEKELEIRNIIAQKLQRGKIDLTFNVESIMPDKISRINEEVIREYFRQLKPIAEELGISSNTDFLRVIMPLPDTMKSEQPELDEEEWNIVYNGLLQSIEQLDAFRIQEGAAMFRDVKGHNESIRLLLEEVVPFEKQRTEKIKNRIKETLKNLNINGDLDENRFEQELIYYIEKLDISEEKIRLKNHIDYFDKTLNEDGPVGKKLGFISQEMGREINTLGSKANDSEIQRLVVNMKDELEKIKEQILNIL
ncbi:TIGR00255 family protein [Thermophagus xiamenensis]|uniref:TIGR00255 family protein n=2 Tax=Thermophagus xiamenensis TaxID=385682 RepID=A0A1I2BJW8_9BACT|nr:TIGR00255 family protein [Thermophagus xiamenensis]